MLSGRTRSRVALLAVWLLALGCATPPSGDPSDAFRFPEDTFAFANELVSDYVVDADGPILAAGPAIGAKENEISYAVGCVTLFGLCALLVYPFLSHAMFGGDPTLAGLFLGTAIHDTAQVAGAGMVYLQQYGGA